MKLEVVSRSAVGTAKATPLLFVHGAWHGAWCWEEHFLPYFAQQGYSVTALSLRGHGGSEGRERLRGFGIMDYVSDVAEVARSLPTPPVVIGHSMGGFVVQKYLEQHPAPAAVLMASAPPAGVLRTTLHLAQHHTKEFIQVNTQFRLYPIVQRPELIHEMFYSKTMPKAKVEDYWKQVQDESYRAFMDMLIFQRPNPSRINTPLMVIGATDDYVFTQEEVRATARAYRTEPHFIPDTAHVMMLEATWQQTADKILSWLGQNNL